jgi:hypothetical protein
MNLLKQGFGFYVFANIHVALASYCLIRITFLEFDFENQSLALFVFFATILSYNMIRLVQLDRINSMTAIWIRAHKKGLVLLNIMALFGLVYFAFDLNLSGFIALLPFVVATLFYVLPMKNKSSGLRQVPGLKLFLIAISWAGITLYFPIQEAGLAVSNQWLFFVQRFLFVLAITIPFDIRDSQFDLRELATLPQVLGVNKAKIVAIIAVLAFLGIDLFLLDISSSMFKIHLLIVLISMVLIVFSSPIRNRFYTTFWVEAIPIVWYILMLLFTDQGVF